MTAPPGGSDGLLGTWAVDREDAPDQRDQAMVVNTPQTPADEWKIYETGRTVAEGRRNEDYRDDAEVAIVVFEDAMRETDLDPNDVPLALGKLNDRCVRFYAFPTPRLKVVGSAIEGEEIRRVAPGDISTSWCHSREFDADAKADLVDDVRDQGALGSVLTARETGDGLELVDGHFRRFLADLAGIDEVAVRVLDLDDEAAAEHYAAAHNKDVSDLPRPPENVPPEFEELEARLADVADVGHERANGGTPVLAVQKLGQRYLITPDGAVHGDGAMRDEIADVVGEVIT